MPTKSQSINKCEATQFIRIFHANVKWSSKKKIQNQTEARKAFRFHAISIYTIEFSKLNVRSIFVASDNWIIIHNIGQTQ